MNSIGNIYYNEESIIENKTENNEEFDFKFISRNEFNSIYKSVQRRRRDELEKKQWDLFIKKKAEEERRKEDIKKNVDTSVQCSGCYWNNLNSSQLHTNDMFSSIPMTFNSHCDESMETSREEFSLQLPSAVNENIENKAELNPSDFTEKLKTIYSQHHSEPHADDEHFDILTKDKDDNIIERGNDISLGYEFNKMESLRSKIVPLLKSIHKLMLKGPDFSEEDTDRVKMRSTEFSNRFKRNYLYRVQCIIKEIEKIINGKPKPVVKEILAQKFISGFQSCLQNLQVIEKTLPKIKLDSVFTLLNDFFMSFCKLTNKFNSIFGDAPKQVTEDIVPLCEKIMDSMIDIIKVKPEPKKKVTMKKGKKKIKDNLWMYSSKKCWASKATELAKLKLAAKNQQTFPKIVSPNENIPSIVNEIPRSASTYTQEMVLLNQKSKLNVRNRDPVAEDEIKTMVEMTDFNETDNSDMNDELQIDVSPTLVEENISDQFMPEEMIGVKDNISPILSPKLSKAPFQNKVSSEKNQIGMKNVALICVQSNTKERSITPENENFESDAADYSHEPYSLEAHLEEKELEEEQVEEDTELEEEEEIYRIKLRECRERMGADDSILNNVTRMSESILKKSMHAAVNDISLGSILTNLIIEELEDN